MDPVTLEGPRLRLRPWRADDDAPLFAINGDADCMRYFKAAMTRTESDAWANRMRNHLAEHGWGFWVAEERATGSFAGVVGLLSIPWDVIPWPVEPATPPVEIGWRIGPGHQRKGFAEEAARLSLAYGFGRLGLPEIVAFTRPDNEASWRLMEKLGMRAAGSFDHPGMEDHPMREQLLYRLSRADWVTSRFG
ncbi:MAG TPA: GNAT family N-acetyltransferase [Roseomonas sp.]|jgi:RimJ/RimL family protein N-acetyltransferase